MCKDAANCMYLFILDRQTGLERVVNVVIGEKVSVTHNVRVQNSLVPNGMVGIVDDITDEFVALKLRDKTVKIPRISNEVGQTPIDSVLLFLFLNFYLSLLVYKLHFIQAYSFLCFSILLFLLLNDLVFLNKHTHRVKTFSFARCTSFSPRHT